MYQKILTPLDGSQRGEKILSYVEELAHKFGSQLILLQVVEPIVMPVSQYARRTHILRRRCGTPNGERKELPGRAASRIS